jgi:hypothetical protein
VACGLDVISRINYAQKPERLAELRARVLGTINRLIRQVAARVGSSPRRLQRGDLGQHDDDPPCSGSTRYRASAYAPTVYGCPT